VSAAGQPAIPERLVSDLLVDDPDMLDLVEAFVDGLSTYREEFRLAFEQLDWNRLAKLAHQLKGAGGSYGYAPLSHLAHVMESAFERHSADHFSDWMLELGKLAAAARAGLPTV
jgi:HPt (histidine-containing phosphotransfer) domain-containing protein